MKKYWACFKNQMDVSIQYRFDLIGYLIIELLTVGGFITLWLLVYKGQSQIGSMKLNDLLIYYLFVPLVGVFSSVTLADTMGKHIKDGFISVLLVKPQKTWLTYMVNDFGHKIYSIIATNIFYSCVFVFVVIVLNTKIEITAMGLGFAFLFAIIGLSVNYAIDLVISTFAFWIDEVWSFKHFKRVLVWLLGGMGFPFEVLSPSLYKIFNLLPFRYFYYVPLSYINGSRDKTNVLHDAAILLFWVIVFGMFFSFLWNRGIKKYGAYGN